MIISLTLAWPTYTPKTSIENKSAASKKSQKGRAIFEQSIGSFFHDI
jgi:hypothetical protein